ncbi:unnamed protein product [Cylicocyclus nassatus]|uniref:Uncharacterized protein n=1 Tax=Cylicocyclus nassatus TaxID=53992 RepID=A0AA36DIL4_CYLNA|nr:unnamed protein product [Cylicocyclus nassatus]
MRMNYLSFIFLLFLPLGIVSRAWVDVSFCVVDCLKDWHYHSKTGHEKEMAMDEKKYLRLWAIYRLRSGYPRGCVSLYVYGVSTGAKKNKLRTTFEDCNRLCQAKVIKRLPGASDMMRATICSQECAVFPHKN